MFGVSPKERAQIEYWTRRVELELLGAVGKAWIHGPVLVQLRKLRGIEGHDSELQLGLASAQSFLKMIDEELAHTPFVAGTHFSIADITLLCVLDFGAGPVHVPMHWDRWPNLKRWHKLVSSRESVVLHKNPYIKGEQRYEAYKDNGVWKPRQATAKL